MTTEADEGWRAEIVMHRSGGMTHVTARVVSDSDLGALDAAQYVQDVLAANKYRMIRVKPTLAEYHLPNQREARVRFSFKDEPGEAHYPVQQEEVRGFHMIDERA